MPILEATSMPTIFCWNISTWQHSIKLSS
uniref:Uncharacterized protein n=1 Tax=Rhizophora mucronata TaxID=61149 RepID=A0A2P2NAC1_RHIMU